MQLVPTVLLAALAAMAVASPISVNAEHEILRREPAPPHSDGSMGGWGGLPDWKRWLSQGEPTWIEVPEKAKRWFSSPTWIEVPDNEERSEDVAVEAEADEHHDHPHGDWDPWGSPAWKRGTQQGNQGW
ncbi:hypothetical protein CONPUDRAFT_85057 [Coniophora puteana RWD-64-598 SS2]|uniref:Uncharacterized protein n=1 Tax=Coniophora puteana (strain RWD-64-598) TaxID=741705 RepID=A0A5M3M987_CONPW|nr:uncharacterized protein CONPUDRAFT_85057 [Coniophora puteana RWD-64-598 SS2]EIW75788.1 hypothetical protein CONPUDRAFT_85057 [Coniophora puteana RWD-64-598 SS2]